MAHFNPPRDKNPDEPDATAAVLKDRQFQARVLGDKAFYHYLYYVESYEWYMSEGIDYDTAYKEMEQRHTELYKDEKSKDPDDIDSLDIWITPEIWENALREYQEFKNTEATHADLGYRKELTAMLAGIKKHEDRYSILDNFYWSFNEEASK